MMSIIPEQLCLLMYLMNKTGWVVPKLNPVAFAQKIQDVIHLPEAEKRKIRQQAIQRIQEKFNLEEQKRMFNAFYYSD